MLLRGSSLIFWRRRYRRFSHDLGAALHAVRYEIERVQGFSVDEASGNRALVSRFNFPRPLLPELSAAEKEAPGSFLSLDGIAQRIEALQRHHPQLRQSEAVVA